MPERPNGKYVSQSDALRVWVPAARDALLEAAGSGERISDEQLSQRIQSATAVSTRQPIDEWFDTLLDRVRADASSRGEQDPTVALVRTTSAVAASTRTPRARAAASRTAGDRAPRERASRAKPPAAPALREITCTSCFMLVPLAPECRECGAPLSAG